jgi:hypothetical protein
MLLPHAERAEVDIRKLRDYCLNPEHWEGKHKARLFAAALGIAADEAADLRVVLLEIILTQDAQLGLLDEYGQRYSVDFLLEWRGRRAMIRTGWIIEHESDTPQLTTCYPL